MKKLLVVVLAIGLFGSPGIAGQSKPNSIQGVWHVVEATITGAGARTISFAERPNLTIITAKHYSRVEVQADGPRPILADVARATADIRCSSASSRRPQSRPTRPLIDNA